ncbi:MAG: Glutamate--cysteine ligase [Firmicutes bacterium]|nr:Glutamate--cysteine ligase [Bacillota bacterium]
MYEQAKINRIVEILKSGEKHKLQGKLGVEIEHIVVNKVTWDSVTFYQEDGIETLLKKLSKFGYEPKFEDNYLVGLENEDSVITLEPGGQLEISIRPCSTLKEIETLYFNFLEQVIPIVEEQNQYLMAIGYHPKSKIKDIPFNPKERYHLMSEYFLSKGKYAHHMMKGTAALQVSIDYSDEKDFIKKLRVAYFLSPLLAVISDNAPIFEGEIYPKNSLRSLIWENTDSMRCGIIPGVMDKEFGYEEYAKYILNVEPIFIIKNDQMIAVHHKKTTEILDEYELSVEELAHICTMVFPDVRGKRYLEIRVGDSLPYPYSFSYIALIKGLFYNEAALTELYRLSQGVDSNIQQKNRDAVRQNGLSAMFSATTVSKFLPFLFELAQNGLPEHERHYVQPLEAMILSQNNALMLAKEKLLAMGLEGLTSSSLNHYIGGSPGANKSIV